MKKQLLKMFYAFIVPVAIGMMFSTSANAQIVYTDVIPDSSTAVSANPGQTITEYYDLDLNNDATIDFRIKAFAFKQQPSSLACNVMAAPLNGNAIKDTLSNSETVTIPLIVNAVIDSNLLVDQSWQTSGWQKLRAYASSSIYPGLWVVNSDNYLGLRLLQAGQTYYGWVRLWVNVPSAGPGSFASFIVRDYAYNSIPNQPILAGEGQPITSGIIENSFASSINLFPNPATNYLTIAFGSINKKVQVTITDITGKVIYTAIATDPDSPSSYRDREQKIEVNTNDFAEGIYTVQIQSADFIGTKKLVVEK